MQGVGFRPFVYRLALRYGLDGWVRNGSAGVLLEAQGETAALAAFEKSLVGEAPPLALVTSLESAYIPLEVANNFTIIASSSDSGSTQVSPDCDVCPDCLAELFDATNRRYRYPFINCTNCGPRYSIITATPYDRPFTTMAAFPLCRECAAEYADPADRRFHAQPIACPVCGPRLQLLAAAGGCIGGDPLQNTIEALHAGKIIAVKGVGGYHLAVDPGNSAAVSELRRRKRRDEKPFALLTASLESAAALAQISTVEGRFLTGVERPILLLRKKAGNRIAPEVAPANDYFGVMLPSTPLHYLLLADFPALVMTSANISEEPLLYRDDEAVQQLAGIADLFLVHNRDIHAPCDDSVIRVFRTHPLLLRRSRGYVPRGVQIPAIDRAVLGAGGELKAVICLARGEQAFLSRHLGDLKNAATLARYGTSISALQKICGITPETVAHDLHPDYHSTGIATTLHDLPQIAVQHHHAHLAACMAENRLEGEVIGIIFDGAGYGADGTIWGGEFLVGGYSGYRRGGHLRQMLLPGGDAAAAEPYRMAISLLYQLYGDNLFAQQLSCLQEVSPPEQKLFLQMLAKGIHSPVTSSCGRLFDGIAALLGVRNRMSYEGQAAIELEGLAELGSVNRLYPGAVIREQEVLLLDWLPLLRALLEDLFAGTPAADIAAAFHHSLAVAAAAVCSEIRRESGLGRVVLSGGVFQNRLLSEELLTLLEQDGFTVFTHRLVPPNDGGLALGQAMIAGRS